MAETTKHNFGYVLAGKTIGEGHKVDFFYRQKPLNDQDSGWCFFSNDDPKDCIDRPECLGIYDVNTILGVDESILPFLDEDVGTAFFRNQNGKWDRWNFEVLESTETRCAVKYQKDES